MPYRLKKSDDSVEQAVRRIAVEQMARAVGEIDETDLSIDETVHQVRKRCKKVRGLIRLVRPVFDRYSAENEVFRDAARLLSPLRDGRTVIETYDALVGNYDRQIERSAFASIRRRLTLQYKETCADTDVDRIMAQARATMLDGQARASEWKLDEDSYVAVSGGLRKTYKRARKAMAKASRGRTADAFHEWRKRVKYHWYHARLLEASRPPMIDPHAAGADRLSDVLGEHHDLAVMADRLRSNPEMFGRSADIDAFLALVERRQKTLEHDAFWLGPILLTETGGALVDRWEAYWKSWHAS